METRMNADRRATALTIALVLVAAAGCGSKQSPEPAAPAPAASAPATATHDAAPVAPPADVPAENPLAGTAWRLVRIMSMDDATYTPDDPSGYTLEFRSDGTARVKADCNSATGSWKSESASQLEFGTMAATMAQCAEGSLHDQYLAQFEWVRSYVIDNGNLFLATMADGSIIEFEPATR
jgi:heat shock protein HslJ